MKGILITGVTGFLGTTLVRHFDHDNAMALFGSSRRSATDKGLFPLSGIRMLNTISAAELYENGIDVIIHLAGIAHDLGGHYGPGDYERVNFGNTKILFDEFLKSDAKQFIFLSSVKAVADSSASPLDESADANPVSAYGKSKRQAEEYILSQPLPGGKQIFILRPCMIHGPGNKGNLNLLYRFVKRGFPFPLGAFENRRSFLSADNFIFVVEKILAGGVPSGVYHLADAASLSTRELYVLLAETMGSKAVVFPIPRWLIRFGARCAGKGAMLNKLTEDFVVSCNKITAAMGCPLPVGVREGLVKTIKSFDE